MLPQSKKKRLRSSDGSNGVLVGISAMSAGSLDKNVGTIRRPS